MMFLATVTQSTVLSRGQQLTERMRYTDTNSTVNTDFSLALILLILVSTIM